MSTDRITTKEDTWRTDELRKYIEGYEENRIKQSQGMQRGGDERRHRSGTSVDRRYRENNHEGKRDGERLKDREQNEETRKRELVMDTYIHRREREGHGRQRDMRNDGERARRQDIDGSRYRAREHKDYEKLDRENRQRELVRSKEVNQEKDKKADSERDRQRRERERQQKSGNDRTKVVDRDRGRESSQVRLRGGELQINRDQRHRSRNYVKESEHDMERNENKREKDRRDQHRGDRERDRGVKDRHGEQEHADHRQSRDYREHRQDKEETVMKQRKSGRSGSSVAQDSKWERRHRDSEGRRQTEHDRERDRHGERRHRSDSEQTKRVFTTSSSHKSNHGDEQEKDQFVGKSESSWRSGQGDVSDPEIPVEREDVEMPKNDEYEEVDYEEDFEDYEEDFEDADEDEDEHEEEKVELKEVQDLSPHQREEIRAIQRAMDEENERVGSTHSRLRTEDSPKHREETESQPSRGRQHRAVMDFVSAKRREVNKKVSSRQKKRSDELLRLIDMDYSVTFSLLDLPPVNEYEMYIRSFGSKNTKQAYVQCNEDNTDREIQTEETDSCDKWTQHPAEANISSGGPGQSQDAGQDASLRTNFDSRRLVSFLRSAAQVMSVLLEEDRAEKHTLARSNSQTDSLSFSDGCVQLNTRLPFLHGRQVSHLHFSDAQRQTLLSVHAPSTKPSGVRLDSQSVVCVWNIWEPSRPQKILVYESEINCCCFSPGKATLVFAGTSVGSIVLWDLREQGSGHYNLTIGESEWTLRYPTFSTDAVLSGPGHLSSVVAVEPVMAPVSGGLRPELPLLANQEESLGLSFQLASLDEKGVLNIWVVMELPKSSTAGSQTDLGLRPGGKVKLLHSSSLQTCLSKPSASDFNPVGPLQALVLKFLPEDSSHYFIGTNMGVVNHGTRHGLKAPPRFYSSQVSGFRPVQVRSLEFCPSGLPHFLIGCDDGSVRLHLVQSEQPLLEWSDSTRGEPVMAVQWALTRPTVFCVLDAASSLHLWDLLEDEQQPVIRERIDKDRLTTMAVFGDAATQNMYSGIALAKLSGRIEIHYFKKRFTVPTPADKEKLDSLIYSAL